LNQLTKRFLINDKKRCDRQIENRMSLERLRMAAFDCYGKLSITANSCLSSLYHRVPPSGLIAVIRV
jgi:hypothetical protein